MKHAKNKAEIENGCAFCEYATELHTSEQYLCSKRGIVAAEHLCAHFSYDPLKRKPRVQNPPKLDYTNTDDL